jgi:hypothetical protein
LKFLRRRRFLAILMLDVILWIERTVSDREGVAEPDGHRKAVVLDVGDVAHHLNVALFGMSEGARYDKYDDCG